MSLYNNGQIERQFNIERLLVGADHDRRVSMCGVAGIFKTDGGSVDERVLSSMLDSLIHRGPDGSGSYIGQGVALGHRRLSVIDLSSNARQPMCNEDQSIWLSCNGEIYNYRELRNELISKGHEFISHTDSEVIIHGYEEEGIDFINRLNGMFALALWDNSTKALYLARDRYGIKPLYYFFNGKVLVFASEVKGLLQHPEISARLNYDALNEYFTFQNLFRYHTLFEGVNLVPPANILVLRRGSRKIQRYSYWDYDFTNCDNNMSAQEACDETERLIKQAVRNQLVADVQVGGYLSGGMDSASIVSVAASEMDRFKTFTCGFDMSAVTGREANFDERRDAELIASYFRTEHYEQVINVNAIEWSLPHVIHHLEDLRLGMSYPNFYIARLASKFVKVCLSGAGGDELYGGYPWRYYRSFLSVNKESFFANYYKAWQRLIPDELKHTFFTEQVWREVKDCNMSEVFQRVFTFNESLRFDTPEDHIANSMYFEIKTFLHGLFIVQDRLSMACSLEERVPLMDNGLVDFAQKIPIHHKLKNLKAMKRLDEDEFRKSATYFSMTNDGKNCLRRAMANLLPKSVVDRPKQGFSAPDESWYRGAGIAYVRKTLSDKKAVYSDFINKSFVDQILSEHCDKQVNHRLLIWSLLCFEWWCRIFLKKETVEFI